MDLGPCCSLELTGEIFFLIKCIFPLWAVSKILNRPLPEFRNWFRVSWEHFDWKDEHPQPSHSSDELLTVVGSGSDLSPRPEPVLPLITLQQFFQIDRALRGFLFSWVTSVTFPWVTCWKEAQAVRKPMEKPRRCCTLVSTWPVSVSLSPYSVLVALGRCWVHTSR